MQKTFFVIIFFIYSSLNFAQVGDKDNHALIIIDMQPYFVTRGGFDGNESNIKKVEEILLIQVKMIESAKASGIPIIFLEYEKNGETNQTLKEAIGEYQEVRYFLKNTDSMFSPANRHRNILVSYLEEKNIGSLIITGANGGACVRDSIDESLIEGYNVIAVSRGIADFNFRDFIYPYVGQYSFSHKHNNCTFKEINDLPEYHLVIANSNANKSLVPPKETDDSSRTTGDKVDVPSNSSRNLKPESIIIEQ